jgi:hypothetical protein
MSNVDTIHRHFVHPDCEALSAAIHRMIDDLEFAVCAVFDPYLGSQYSSSGRPELTPSLIDNMVIALSAIQRRMPSQQSKELKELIQLAHDAERELKSQRRKIDMNESYMISDYSISPLLRELIMLRRDLTSTSPSHQ